MKRYVILILSLLFTADLWAGAPEKLTVENTKVRKVDETVEVSFDVRIDKLNRNYQVVLTPVLYNGSNRQALDPVVITGNRRNLYEIRNRMTGDNGYIVKSKSPRTFNYVTVVPYREWMSTVSLSLGQVVTGCCDEQAKPSRTPTSSSITRSRRLSTGNRCSTSSPSWRNIRSKTRSCTPSRITRTVTTSCSTSGTKGRP